VQKAPSATIETLALALKQLLHAENPLDIIGTRHGEKLYETLLTREEMVVAEDMGGYFRVPADNRDLNYALYFSEGRHEVSVRTDYNSHNVKMLDVDGMCDLLGKLVCVQEAMKGQLVTV
jgi:UDP-glucose 4-epimerase